MLQTEAHLGRQRTLARIDVTSKEPRVMGKPTLLFESLQALLGPDAVHLVIGVEACSW